MQFAIVIHAAAVMPVAFASPLVDKAASCMQLKREKRGNRRYESGIDPCFSYHAVPTGNTLPA